MQPSLAIQNRKCLMSKLILSKAANFSRKRSRVRLNSISFIPIFFIVLAISDVSSDGLLCLHDNQHNKHKHDNNTPLLSIHGIHGEDSIIEPRGVGNEDLQESHNGIRPPSNWVSNKSTTMKGTLSGKAGTHGYTNRSKRQSVQGLRSCFFQRIPHVISPKDRPNSTGNQNNGSNGNAQEQEAANESLSNTARRLVHDTIFSRFHSTDKSKGHSTDQVTVEHLNSRQRSFTETQHETKQDRHSLGIVDGSIHQEHLSKIIPNNTSLTDSRHNSGKVIISQNHFGSFTGNISSFFAHGNSHISSLEGRGIIHTITSHTTDFTNRLQSLDNADLVLGRSACKHIVLWSSNLKFLISHSIQFWSSDSFRVLLVNQTKHPTNGKSSVLVVTGDHGNTDTSTMGNLDGINTFWAGRIHDCAQSNNSQPRLTAFLDKLRSKLFTGLHSILVEGTTSQGKNTETMRRQNSNLFNPVVLVTRFKIFFLEASIFGLVFAQRNHTIRCSLDMGNQLVIVVHTIILLNRSMNSGHELVLRTERNFSNHRGTVLDSRHINISKVSCTKDRKFSGVSNLSFASTILSKATLGAKDTSSKCFAQKDGIRTFTSDI
mmetsp:Transcript_19652/g.40856  ORF Transcript_19652/g.40856 Transcript_19652/m.40856 type:complete len:601 (+) Transcript_19652:212-2014(+)